MKKKWYLGIDIGVSSCGVACCDEDFNIIKWNGKECWVSRLFDKANTCKDRRMHRGTRRHVERRKKRIRLIRELFAEEVLKKDPLFYKRLDQAQLQKGDKEKALGKFTLFNDVDGSFTDFDYHKKFPTVYHLRKALLDKNHDDHEFAIIDIRLVFLACEHIVKYRGNFLYDDWNIEDIRNFDVKDELTLINQWLKTAGGKEIDEDALKKLRDISLKEHISKKDKIEQICKELKYGKNSLNWHLIDALVFRAVKLKNFSENQLNESIDIKLNNKISFHDETWEPTIAAITNENGELAVFLQALSKFAQKLLWSSKMKNEKYISNFFIKIYDQHRKNLDALKSFLYINNKEMLNEFFSKNGSHYARVIGHDKNRDVVCDKTKDKNREREDYVRDHELFVKHIRENIHDKYKEKFENDSNFKTAFGNIDNDEFYLSTQHYANKISNFPFQLHLVELKEILNNASEHWSFLSKRDEELSILTKDKIIKILEFKMPYYVGLTSNAGWESLSKNELDRRKPWIEFNDKKTQTHILPWNIKQVVNLEKTATNFIQKMINKCTYLCDEPVLPKESIIYQQYMCLNELNKIKIKGKNIQPIQKTKVWENLYLKGETITSEKIFDLLSKQNSLISNEITKKDIEINEDLQPKNSISSLKKLEKLFGGIDNVLKNIETAEEIIKNVTILYNDKKMMVEKIIKQNPDFDSDEKRLIIRNLKFLGWGRLSKKLLTDFPVSKTDQDTGEIIDRPRTILEILKTTNDNLMQILESSKYNAKQEIENFNKNREKLVDSVDDFFQSSPLIPSFIKRSFNEAVKCVDEYIDCIGCPPEKIFIETTRFIDRDKSKKPEKKKVIKDKLTKINKTENRTKDNIREILNILNSKDDSDIDEKLTLYFYQLGKDMYSEKPIELDRLMDYEVDHIVPQSYTINNSIDNKVLVKRDSNQRKLNQYPFVNSISSDVQGFWKYLWKQDLISKAKYDNLTRNRFDPNDQLEFINRDLVQTGWEVKSLIKYFSLNKKYEKIKIIPNKPLNTSYLREKLDLPKNRKIDDLHHAEDAYLNIISGKVIDDKYGDSLKKKGWSRGIDYSKFKNIYDSIDKLYEVISDKKENIINFCQMKGALVTRKIIYKPKHSGLFNQTLLNKRAISNQKDSLPKKQELPKEEYGGYGNISSYFYAFIKCVKNNKTKYIIHPIYTHKIYNWDMFKILKTNFADFSKKIEQLVKEEMPDKEIKCIYPFIPHGSILKYKNNDVYIRGRTNDDIYLTNAYQFKFSAKQSEILHEIFIKNKNPQYDISSKLIDEDFIYIYEVIWNYANSLTFSNPIKKNIDHRTLEMFKNLPIWSDDKNNKITWIIEIFNFLKLDKNQFEFNNKKILLKISKNISDPKGLKLIQYSPTGLKHKQIKLI